MNADVITNLDYPHSTVEGFHGGCNTAHCPAEVSCRTVHTRYVGDWAFRRQVNAGQTPAEIVAAEEEQAREAARADLAAKRARPGVRAGASREDRRAAANRARSDGLALIPRHTLRELLNAGLTDREIAEKLGLHRRQVTGSRRNAGYERNPDRNRRPAPATTGASSMEAG
ncbi:hypothetical protein ILP86_04600 [Microbacterium sp. R1]|uniref:Transcription factor n=1 Tax=Microbacterium phage vB_MoxS-R1 TaxID=2848881 RepID=A0A8F2IVF6_9CAUD|nr:hypothetical protein [Microbacterium sp. R1]YP_010649908.1 transcription factor [Microbacterium phage vB_MoxS-R1]MBE7953600.1 hypothetical protein [Microbacterium sp. R1]QWT28878.1 transcription factor [Microbacterium phage vB_MoxS-R1]